MRLILSYCLCCLTLALLAVSPASTDQDLPSAEALGQADLTRLTLARAEYDSCCGWGEAYYGYEGRVWQRWETDFPQAEHNLAKRLGELTRLSPALEPVQRRFTAPDLGDFPLLFMSDPGYMRFTPEEAEGLRNYLMNGGFLWVDDFWGDAEWASFERFMQAVLPGNHWREVPRDHPVFHMVFEFDEMPQIPARSFADGGSVEPPWVHRQPTGSLREPAMRGYYDDEGRLMVIGTHNTDIFDGWEREAYGSWYFEQYSTQSYRLGVNILTWVLTH